jgi:hypothetical protein
MKKPIPLTYPEHASLGTWLQEQHANMVRLYNHLTFRYGKSSRAAGRCRKVVKDLDALRCELDSLACIENPMSLYPDLEPDRLYYGKGGGFLE